MKLTVTTQINYYYEIDAPDKYEGEDPVVGLLDYCDMKDPVYDDIAKIMSEKSVGWDGETISIYRDGEEIYIA